MNSSFCRSRAFQPQMHPHILAALFMSLSAPCFGQASATFFQFDTSTQGNWPGVYGQAGVIIADDVNAAPAWAAVSLAGTVPSYTWVASSVDPRALLKSTMAVDRIASAFYSATSFRIRINLTDGNTHQVAVYFLDLDSATRNEQITVLDSYSNAVLDQRTLSNVHNGVFGVWSMRGDVTLQVTNAGGLNAVLSGLFFRDFSAPPPTVGLDASPIGSQLAFDVLPFSPVGVAWVQLQIDGADFGPRMVIGFNGRLPFDGIFNGPHLVTAIATDREGQTGTSPGVPITVTANAPAAPSASFVGIDTTTHGNWISKYFFGYVLANGPSFPQNYMPNFLGANVFTWTPSTQAVQALQLPYPQLGQRMASAFYGAPDFGIDLRPNHGYQYQLALYFLDWDGWGRVETVRILDAVTQATLDTRTVSDFVSGKYLIWTITGLVIIEFHGVAGPNAVVSGIFDVAPAF